VQDDPILARSDEGEEEVAFLRRTVVELQEALESRVIIEQAKGILAVNDRIAIDVAFDRLRRAARNTRQPLRDVAVEIVAAHESKSLFSRR
jgi:AmiR/NasT family two-component response regulator